MLRPDDVRVTTAGHLEGYELEANLGVVTTHFVGEPSVIHVMEDIFSPYGNGSKSIDRGQRRSRKKLVGLDEKVLFQLKQKAADRGGNGIVGVRIERTPVAGKEETMLLITATGTAVWVKKAAALNATDTSGSTKQAASADELMVEVKKQEILTALNEEGRLAPSQVEFLAHHRVHEEAPKLLALLEESIARDQEDGALYDVEDMHPYKRYFMQLEPRRAKDVLYPVFETENDLLTHFALEILRKRKLFDEERVEELLGADEERMQKAGLRLLGVPKSQYVKEDIDGLKRLLEKARKVVTEYAEKQYLSPVMDGAWERLCEPLRRSDAIGEQLEHIEWVPHLRMMRRPNDTVLDLSRKIEALERLFGAEERRKTPSTAKQMRNGQAPAAS